jgi:hypothetical protein
MRAALLGPWCTTPCTRIRSLQPRRRRRCRRSQHFALQSGCRRRLQVVIEQHRRRMGQQQQDVSVRHHNDFRCMSMGCLISALLQIHGSIQRGFCVRLSDGWCTCKRCLKIRIFKRQSPFILHQVLPLACRGLTLHAVLRAVATCTSLFCPPVFQFLRRCNTTVAHAGSSDGDRSVGCPCVPTPKLNTAFGL